MTKDEIQLLCKADEELSYWAVTLFAEISALLDTYQEPDLAVLSVIRTKVKEFDRLVIQRSLDKAAIEIEKREKV